MHEKVKVIVYLLPNGDKVQATPEAWLVALISTLDPATLRTVCAKLAGMSQPGAHGIYTGADRPLSLIK